MRARHGPFLPAAFLLAAFLLVLPARATSLTRYEGTRLSMGCVYAIVAYGEDAAALPRIVDEALDEVDRIDRLMSNYKPESPLSRLNREAASPGFATPVAVDPELFDMIAESLRYSRESDGAFDITVGPLMKAWGFFNADGHMPATRVLDEARRRVGYRHVLLDPSAHTIRFDQRGVELDLGGIAKGYAVDRVVSLLRERHVAAALVSAGGSTLYALGAPPGEEGWEVNVQDPLQATQVALTLRLKDRSLSIAGRSEKSFEVGGVTYSHIMDPRTGRPVQGMLTVAVLSATGTQGDALDDVLFVQGVEKSRGYLARLTGAGIEAYLFLPAVRPGGQRGWTQVHLQERQDARDDQARGGGVVMHVEGVHAAVVIDQRHRQVRTQRVRHEGVDRIVQMRHLVASGADDEQRQIARQIVH
jgi:thiamine biosynthesis lipoprotein